MFGIPCKDLPPVFKKHYDLSAYIDQESHVTGALTVKTLGVLTLLRPFYRLLGGLPLVTAENVPVTVQFKTTKDDNGFQFNRTFNFPGTKPYAFNSTMYPVKNNEFYEVLRFGVSWCFTLSFEDDNKIVYQHRGYGFRLLNRFIPLPITALVGKGAGEEVIVDADSFDMWISFTHPLLGLLYTYYGRFTFIDTA